MLLALFRFSFNFFVPINQDEKQTTVAASSFWVGYIAKSDRGRTVLLPICCFSIDRWRRDMLAVVACVGHLIVSYPTGSTS